MKLRSITLNNVRRFTAPAQVDGIADGLNVLCEPNEHGKSTLFDALQAVFFKPHGSRDKDVQSLKPHAGGAPEVSVGIETDAGTFIVAKRWLGKPAATVHRNGTLIAQSDEAEAWIADLLGGDAGGPSGLIWVRQGVTGLTEGSNKQDKAALEARRDLMTSVGEEVETMTGGRRMDMALARCREELALYATNTGRPAAKGPWKQVMDDVAALTEKRDALAETARTLHEALAARKRARRDLAEWQDEAASKDRQTRLTSARAAYSEATRHAELIETASRKADLARLTAEAANGRLAGYREALAEQAEAEALARTLTAQATLTTATLEDRRQTRDAAEKAAELAQDALTRAEATWNAARAAQAARDGAEKRADLQDRITKAEAARHNADQAEATARTGLADDALRSLETLAVRLEAAIANRDASAPQITAHYEAGVSGAILMGEAPLQGGQPRALLAATRLTIAGVGALEIRPSEAGSRDGQVETAKATLAKALAASGQTDLATARASALARTKAEQARDMAKAVIQNLAPKGIAALHEALARIPVLDSASDAPDPSEAEAALNAAKAAHSQARAARDIAAEGLADARTEATRAETAHSLAKDRLARATEGLARFGTDNEATLTTAATTAEQTLLEAGTALAELRKSAPDLETAKAALDRAESIAKRAADESAELTVQLAKLDERISRASGDAVEERLAETGQALEAAQTRLARIEHEVAVLMRLGKALETARNDARERYFAPIARELKPLLNLLWPEAELTWGEEDLLPVSLIRDGQEEPLTVLSGGTQEQIALMVRLAFARMLSHAGRSAPVILDDALVFTDDDRIERMFDALHRQAGDLQIIVLTCRQRAFRQLGGNSLRLGSGPAS